MTFKRHSSRWTLWVFAAALLLKSAMPFLANASAQLQGIAIAEVCTVHGVVLAPLTGDGHQKPVGSASGYGGEHCALTALATQAIDHPPVAEPNRVAADEVASARAHRSSSASDACAAWIARLRHGPPRFA